jgi:hypothetical protein
MSRELRLTQDVHGPDDACQALLASRALELGLTEIHSDTWATAAAEIGELGQSVLRVVSTGHESTLAAIEGALLHVALGRGWVGVAVAAADGERARELLAELRNRFPAPAPVDKHEVTVTFWTYGSQGPQQSWRSIAVPGWDDISSNYSTAVQAKLGPIMQDFQPAHGGQLLLWHGEPGTGKTFGLRALAWEWRQWCHFHYIVDPDAFFGEHADYLMGVLLQPGYVQTGLREGYGSVVVSSQFTTLSFEGDEDGEDHQQPWRVLVLEDTGELLSADAKARMGQGLSRFLNVVDGLIGQGLRVLVLVTTNEEIRSLHPAVARPGRCAANVYFGPLEPGEATAWLTRHEIEERAERPMTLAELYARVHGVPPEEIELAQFDRHAETRHETIRLE